MTLVRPDLSQCRHVFEGTRITAFLGLEFATLPPANPGGVRGDHRVLDRAGRLVGGVSTRLHQPHGRTNHGLLGARGSHGEFGTRECDTGISSRIVGAVAN